MRKSDINVNSYNATGLERSAWGGWYWLGAGTWPCTKLYSSPKLAPSCMTFGKLNNMSIPQCPWTKEDYKDKCLFTDMWWGVSKEMHNSPGIQEVCRKRWQHQDRILQNQSCRIGRFGLVQWRQKTCQYKAWGKSRGVILEMQKMKHHIDISRP